MTNLAFRFSITALPCPIRRFPGEAISSAVRPHGAVSGHGLEFHSHGGLDYVMTAPNAHSNDPDKQWITVDLSPLQSSLQPNLCHVDFVRFQIRAACLFPFLTQMPMVATPIGPLQRSFRPSTAILGDSYMLPHVTPDGTVYTTETNNPQQKGFPVRRSIRDLLARWRSDLADASARTP